MTHQPAIQWPHDKTTAPKWEDYPVEWCVWYLESNPQVYREFRRICDERLQCNPDSVLSADMALHVLRWNTPVTAQGDKFQINDHASALFARLYVLERPTAQFRSRKSFLDVISPTEWQRILNAFEPIRVKTKGG